MADLQTMIWNSTEFRGNQWKLMEFHAFANFPSDAVTELHGISTKIPCVSTEYMENTMESWT